MTFGNGMNSKTQFRRFPATRIFIEDLTNGVWDDEEKVWLTRYGKMKRVRLCAVVLRRKEVLDENSEENSFLSENFQSNSRLSFLVDDGTGKLWATLWGVNPELYSRLEEGDLLDLVGKLGRYQNDPQITLEIARKVTNPNYESYHILEILKKRKFDPFIEVEKIEQSSTEYFEFDDKETFEAKLAENESYNPDKINESDYHDESKDRGKKQASNQVKNDITAFKEIDIKDQIVSFIQDIDQGDGVALTKIAEKFKIEKGKLKEILDDLCQDIQLYKSQPGHYSSY